MARKLVKSLLLAAGCGAGLAMAAEPVSIQSVDSTREAYSVSKQESSTRGDEYLNKANQAFAAGDFKEAAYNYAQAALLYDSLKENSDYFKERYAKTQELVAKSYYYLAQQIALKAEAESNAGDLERAIAYCKEAMVIYPAGEKELQSRIDAYEKMRAAVAKRASLAEDQVIPDLTDQQYKIAVLLKQAKILYYTRQFQDARDRYNEVLLLDKINPEAIQGLQATNFKIREAGEARYRMTHDKNMAEASWEPVTPIITRKDADVREENGMAATTPISEIDDTVALRNKLQSIVIPTVKFTGDAQHPGTPLPAALKYLRDRSKLCDPAGEGVNIFLYYPDPAERTMGADGMGMNDMPGGANMEMAAGFNALASQNTRRNARRNAASEMRPGRNNDYQDDYGNEEDAYGDEEDLYGDEEANQEEEEENKYPIVNLDLNNKTLLEIIDAVAAAANPAVKYKIEKNCVVFAPVDAALDDMEIKIVSFDESLLESLGGSSDPDELKAQFETYGVPFPTGAKVMYDSKFRALIALNTPENLNKLNEVVVDMRKQDPPPLVQLQVKFVEVRQNDLKELGFIQTLGRPNGDGGETNGRLQFDENDSLLRGTDASTQNPTFTYSRSDNGYDYSLAVNALNQLDSKDVLSSPKVLTNPGKKVTIKMTTERYFAWDYDEGEFETNSSSSSSSGTSANTYIYTPPWPEFELQELGITMEITPTVDVDKRLIMMNVCPWVRTFVGWTSYTYTVTDDAGGESGGVSHDEEMTRPIIAERTTDTTVSVYDNETVVIGGIIKDYTVTIDDKVPFLGDIPLIGRFFQSKATTVEKTNLLIFLTARMLKPDGSGYYKFDYRGRPSAGGLGDLY